MSWIGKALGVVGKIGGIASKFAGAGGVIGKIAGGISKAASLVTSAKAAPWIAGAAAIVGVPPKEMPSRQNPGWHSRFY